MVYTSFIWLIKQLLMPVYHRNKQKKCIALLETGNSLDKKRIQHHKTLCLDRKSYISNCTIKIFQKRSLRTSQVHTSFVIYSFLLRPLPNIPDPIIFAKLLIKCPFHPSDYRKIVAALHPNKILLPGYHPLCIDDIAFTGINKTVIFQFLIVFL